MGLIIWKYIVAHLDTVVVSMRSVPHKLRYLKLGLLLVPLPGGGFGALIGGGITEVDVATL